MISQDILINCEFSEPVYWDNDLKVLKPVAGDTKSLQNWNFQKMICSGTSTGTSTTDNFFSESFLIEHPTTTAGNFLISRSYNYGDITEILLLGGIFLVLVILLIKKFFTKEPYYFKRWKIN